jgi:serine O-acetyltransferase
VSDSTAPPSAIERLKESVPEVHDRHPPFLEAVLTDARVAAAFRGERHEFSSRLDGLLQVLRLMLQTDAFFALAAYRAKASLQARGIPVLPWIAHRLAMMSAQISISDTVIVQPGVFIPHGQVVMYGLAEVSSAVALYPWVTLAPTGGGAAGPKVGPGTVVGTGAKIVGDVEVGANSRIGVNAVVLDDVPANTTVVGMPAQPIAD